MRYFLKYSIFKRYKGPIEGAANSNSGYRINLLKNIDHEFDDEQYTCRSKDGKKEVFTRKRFFTIRKLVVVIMLLKTSYQRELDKFCKTLMGGEFNIREVTKGALTQARAKLNPWAFQRLNEVSVEAFYDGAEYLEWKGMRVLAVDGSNLKLPKSQSIIEEFGLCKVGRNKEKDVCMARCSLLYDVLNHVTIDAQIGPYRESEKSLFVKHFPKLSKGDLVLGDRGYPSTELMLRLVNQEVEYCFRMKEHGFKVVSDFTSSGVKQQLVELSLSTKAKAFLTDQEPPHTIACRLIKITLDNGEIEILATSLLDEQQYEYEQFEALYHTRWNVEEGYKLLKSRIEIEAFSGKTARSIHQDFHAKVLMLTLCATLAFPIEQKVREEYSKNQTGNKYDQQINRTSAIGVTKESLISLIIRKSYQQGIDCMDMIIENTREVIRKDRRNKIHKKPKRLFHTAYKPIA